MMNSPAYRYDLSQMDDLTLIDLEGALRAAYALVDVKTSLVRLTASGRRHFAKQLRILKLDPSRMLTLEDLGAIAFTHSEMVACEQAAELYGDAHREIRFFDEPFE